ncbi:DUF397 domain-containing protein [Actinokineospora sp. G85]|uniref:DUF397 domain-containing protein n=1 Tax=Actinokineospora sp. G85 TaxID=3406626 RepID=UPI003C7172BC
MRSASSSADFAPAGPFRKSSRSGGGPNCVELAPAAAGWVVRDSKQPNGPVLHLSHAAVAALVAR